MTTSAQPVRAATRASSGSRRPLTSLRIAAPASIAAAATRGLPGVDGDEHALGAQPLDQRDDALDLDLVRGVTSGVGDAGLAADVDQVGALGDERERVLELALERVEADAVRERVRARR